MVRCRRRSVRPDQPLPCFMPTTVAVTKPRRRLPGRVRQRGRCRAMRGRGAAGHGRAQCGHPARTADRVPHRHQPRRRDRRGRRHLRRRREHRGAAGGPGGARRRLRLEHGSRSRSGPAALWLSRISASSRSRTLPGRCGSTGFETTAAAAQSRSAQTSPALPLPDKPSIAVLPFANMSGDPEQEYFADGMVEEIITALSPHPLALRHRPQFDASPTRASRRCEAGRA